MCAVPRRMFDVCMDEQHLTGANPWEERLSAYVCVLHERAFVCTSVCVWMQTCTYIRNETSQFVYHGCTLEIHVHACLLKGHGVRVAPLSSQIIHLPGDAGLDSFVIKH